MKGEIASDPRPDSPGTDSGTPSDSGRRHGRRASRALEITLLIFVPLALLAIFHHFAPTRPRSDETTNTMPLSFTSDDEAARLSQIRQTVERNPGDWSGAVAALRDFIVTANDPALRERAIAWKKALDSLDEERTYRVRLRKFRLSRAGYEQELNSWLEPGDPDVYLKVFRRRDGRDEVVYDGRNFVLEGWGGEWDSARVPEGATDSFSFSWKRGEPIRVSLMEKDMAGDNVIADYVCDSGLAILLVSSPRISSDGHIIELESDFAFGK